MGYDIIFIGSIVQNIVEKSKSTNGVKSIFGKGEDKHHINYSKNYHLKVELMENIKYHAELNNFPEEIFIAKAPRQTPEEFKYIKDNYKQVTLPVYLDFISTVSRIFHDTNYSVDYSQDDTNIESEITYEEYVEGGMPIYGSLENFIKFLLPHLKLTDANGIIAVKPYEINYIKDGAGNLVVDDSELFEPIPYYFSSEQIIMEEADEYYLVETGEKSEVEYYNRMQNVGRVFEFYDDQNIYKIYQVGKFSDNEFVVELYFNHGSGEVPCIKLQGIPTLQRGELMYVSPFSYATDLLDLVAINSSYLQVVINNCVFPFRVMYGDICEFEYNDRTSERSICSNGWVYDSSLGKQVMCPSCNGSGLKSRVSPLGVMLLKPKTNLNEGDSGLQQNPIEYVEPTMNTPEFLMKKIDSDEGKARKILHLHTSNSNVTGSPTLATDMMLDLKALYAFLKPISDQIFGIWEFVANQIGWQRLGDKFLAPTFVYPVNFDFNTEADYTAQISEAIKAGMPPFVLQTLLYKYLKTIYYTDKSTSDVFNLIYNTDRLMPFTSDEIALKQARGNTQKWEVILHDSALTFVDELVITNPDFFSLPFIDQQTALIDKAKAIVNNIEGGTALSSQSIVKSIMDNSANIANQNQ